MRVLKLMADYDCWPLWEAGGGAVGNVDPASLPISADLKARLDAWAQSFTARLDRDDPSASPALDDEAVEAFRAEGRALAARLEAELGPGYRIVL